jgi:ribosomal protein L1
LSRHGKRYLGARGQVDREREYTPREAIELIKALPAPKFDETVEVHVRTGLNVRHADEQLRGTIALPNGLGKEVKIAVFAQGDKAREAEEAGADVVGAEDLAKRVEDGFTDFDVAIATPDLMPVVGRLGRVLGPQGKMPNPKVGTVTMDVGRAVQEAKAGVPHRPHGDRPPPDRQALVPRPPAAGELRRRPRRAHPCQARGRQGPLPAHDRARSDDGPRREGRPVPYPRHPRGRPGRSRLSAHEATTDPGHA